MTVGKLSTQDENLFVIKRQHVNCPVMVIAHDDFALNTNIKDIDDKSNQYTNLLKIPSMKLFFRQSLMVFPNMRRLKGKIMESLRIASKNTKSTPNLIKN